jgi:AcrR family transcriptional regulator
MESDSPTLPAPHPQRGRPRQFCPEEALTAALKVFWERGYEGASLAELTEAMGITKPSLYACFGNKEALFCKALDLYERDKLAYVRAPLPPPPPRAWPRPSCAARWPCNRANDPRGCLGVISAVACTNYADRSRRGDGPPRLVRIRRCWATRQGRGRPAPGVEPEAMANYLSAILQGMMVQARSGASPRKCSAWWKQPWRSGLASNCFCT